MNADQTALALSSVASGSNYTRAQALPDILRQRIVLMDGAMGVVPHPRTDH